MKTKLTPALQKKIGDNIILGMPIKYAAEVSGITERAFYYWMDAGEKAKSGLYYDFYNYINECKAKSIQTHLKLITKAAKAGTWVASAWLLERRFPDEFGKKDKLDLDANLKHSGKIDINTLSDEQLIEIINNEPKNGSCCKTS